MSKVTVIESRDHEADYWVKQIKNGADEQEHRSFRDQERFMSSELFGSINQKKK